MIVYLKTPDHERRSARLEEELEGRLAMFRLLLQQRTHCGLDTTEAETEIARAGADRAAARARPGGTVLHSRPSVVSASIWVIDGAGNDVYLGPPEGYPGEV